MNFSLAFKTGAVLALCALCSFISYRLTANGYRSEIDAKNLEVLQLKAQVEESLVNSFVEVYDNADSEKEQLKKDYEDAIASLRESHNLYLRNNTPCRLSESTNPDRTVSATAKGSKSTPEKTTHRQLTEDERTFREELLKLAHQCDLNAVQNNALIDLLQKEREATDGY